MAKFFIPILAFLIGLLVYVLAQEKNPNMFNKTENAQNPLINSVADYVRMRDSLIRLPEYSDFKEVSYYKVSYLLPNYLDTTSTLSSTAFLQYQNLKKEFYILLYSSSSYEYTSVDDYYKSTLSGIKSILTNYVIVDSSFTNINNASVYRADITGVYYNGVDSLPLKYKVLVTSLDDFYYDLTEWTIVKNLKQNEDDMNKVMSSFLYKPDIEEVRKKLEEWSF